ncbi:FAD-dependent oxidoreductase [Oricola sp.]|uniref:FAD-dependent oxidoreductase n=1 Tax=Oricola sp. TaxID=1979950 RepID=UPI0025EB5927|nr:FAD-dependent oxidoreductase [Oricola sp.]MCI5076494.1 FAD-dependent oxidoreductase [Oricola sp.]
MAGRAPTDNDCYDIAVLGAGAAGLSAAVFAALEGRRTILIEKTEYVGGTSAYSAATTWVPNTRLAKTVDSDDTPERVKTYLDNAVGNRAPADLRAAFVEHGPEAIHTLLDKTDAQFRARPFHPDYLYELEGSTSCGRALEPIPFDGKPLGDDLRLIRPPIPEFTILGGLMVDRDDISQLLNMAKSPKSLVYSVKLIGRYALDRLRFGKSTRLVMGNALIGRLLLTARKLGVEIVTEANVTDIAGTPDERLVTYEKAGQTREIRVAGGVILASGGFARHPQRRAEMLPSPTPEYSPSAPGHTGALHDIALKLGARYGEGGDQNAFLAPVSLRKRKDGTMAVFPHFVFDRSKPGIISVGADGKRFTNEARSYHEFVIAMYRTGTIPAFLVTDAAGLRKYGLGMVRPGGRGWAPFLADGYLTEGKTLADLAQRLGVDAGNLQETVRRMGNFARAGVDEDFHRGETVYECGNGDATHGPNPTLGALDEAPFYAVRLFPGDIGSATGLQTDASAQVLGVDNKPLGGIYACGNDMHSIMGGVYPGPGITIGPGIAFGYVAARHASARIAP